MGTVVLRSQDCLKSRFPSDTYRPTFPQNQTRNSSPNSTRMDRRKRRYKDNVDNGETVVRIPSTKLVMGKVTILKRGEELKTSSPSKDHRSDGGFLPVLKSHRSDGGSSNDDKKSEIKEEDSALSSTDRLGPEPELVPKQVRLSESKPCEAVYAGSAFFSSPSPNSLPIPAFFARKDSLPNKNVNDVATKDLCRLLRLDLL